MPLALFCAAKLQLFLIPQEKNTIFFLFFKKPSLFAAKIISLLFSQRFNNLYNSISQSFNTLIPLNTIKDIYKIGIGPSSSHTMGPQKAAQLFNDRYPNADAFEVTLYGSLAATGKGHMTDWAK